MVMERGPGMTERCTTSITICLIPLSVLLISLGCAKRTDVSIQELTRRCFERGGNKTGRCLERIATANLDSVEAQLAAARYFASQGNPERAIDFLDHALELTPDNIDINIFRAQALKAMGDLDGATAAGEVVRELRRARLVTLLSESAPDPAELRVLAVRESAKGNFDNACRLYQRYFETQETPYPLNLANYAEVLARTDQFDAAFEVMDRAFDAVEEGDLNMRASLLRKRAWIREWSGDSVGAENDRNEYRETVTLLSDD
jgi:tetratricopeptide (TPR) repeat protein